MGCRQPARRSTLAEANEGRDWRIHSEVAQRLIAQARKLHADEDLALDASPYTLLQILSVTFFEKMPFHQALAGDESRYNHPQIANQSNLFAF